ncbi:ABC transporter substrate-binding protein [Nonomuraea ferruginea]
MKITLTARYGVLRAHLTNLPIIHKDFVAKTDTTMGTGPFTIEKVTQGQSVELSRNDSYHGDKPALASVVFQAVPDPATRLVNLREGKIHIMTDVTPESVALLKQDAQVKVHEVDAPSDIITYFTANKAPFGDVKVRQALAYAMDRKGVRDVAYAGTATIAQGPIGPAVEGHDPSLQIYGEAPDHEKAKALLAEAGASDLKFTLTITSDAMMKNIGQVLVEGWKQARHHLHAGDPRRRPLGAEVGVGQVRPGDEQLRDRLRRRAHRLLPPERDQLGVSAELRLQERGSGQAARPGLGRRRRGGAGRAVQADQRPVGGGRDHHPARLPEDARGAAHRRLAARRAGHERQPHQRPRRAVHLMSALLSVRDLGGSPSVPGRATCPPCARSPSTSPAARSSGWSASRGRARARCSPR